MNPGALDRRAQFRRRGVAGGTLTAFADLGAAVWAAYRATTPVEARLADLTFDLAAGEITLRDNPWSRGITTGDRVRVDGQDFEVRSAGRDRRSTALTLAVQAIPDPALIARLFAQDGETVILRRIAGGLPDAPVRARVTGYRPVEADAGMHVGDRTVLVLAADVAAAGWPAPASGADQVVVRGGPLMVETVDDNTHRLAGDLIAYEIVGRG
jgi:hypothetical protein